MRSNDDSDAPRSCRTVASLHATYAIAVATAVLGIVAIGLSIGAVVKKTDPGLWIAAFVFYAAGSIMGMHADSLLRVKLATGMCNDDNVRAAMLGIEFGTSVIVVAWMAFAIVLGVRARFLQTKK